jgi:hypothetical protein
MLGASMTAMIMRMVTTARTSKIVKALGILGAGFPSILIGRDVA